ncbi:hypothetical protein POM88_010399 [Heracleum sosnowskyi]|uniref:Uncharacterized protein n=1 Tax=Heracleum sosnowskyi TaxID=360622 RepID=A0AAD8IUB9_9APIA|nr:hypothetical protein POM88_010399 [Heracleum sosnowskyi]
MIQKWRSALSEIAELSGHHLRKEANENESNTIQEIVGNVETWTSATTVSRLEKYLCEIDSAVDEIYEELDVESKIDVLEKSLSEINSAVKEKYQELNMKSKIDVLEKSIVPKIDVLQKSLVWIGSAVEEIVESDDESDDDFFSFF